MIQYFLIFIVDGEWSFWSSWDKTCSNRCGKGVIKRTRECNSPAPINGGNECPGNAVQKKSCTSMECPGKLFMELNIYLFIVTKILVKYFMGCN